MGYRLFVMIVSMLALVRVSAWNPHSVNIDIPSTTALTSALYAENIYESKGVEQLEEIFKTYQKAALAVSGIYNMKRAEIIHLRSEGIFSSRESFYYNRIHYMVRYRIIPKIFTVVYLLIEYPDRAIFWGPYMAKVMSQTQTLCKIFQSVVTNGRLSFSDITFPEFNDEFVKILGINDFGKVNWKRVFDGFANIDLRGVSEDLKEDFETIKRAGITLANEGSATLNGMLSGTKGVGKLFKNKPKEIIDTLKALKDVYDDGYQTIQRQVGTFLAHVDTTNFASLFKAARYNGQDFMPNYESNEKKQYYRDQYLIVCKDKIYDEEVYFNFMPTGDCLGSEDDDDSHVKRLAEEASGWNESRVQQLNKNSTDGTQYTITYNILHKKKTVIWGGLFGEVEITLEFKGCNIVIKRKVPREDKVYYYEWFDSYDMQLDAFLNRMEAKRQSLEADLSETNTQTGDVTKTVSLMVKKGNRVYYDLTDSHQMQGVYNATFSVNCEHGGNLYEGSFSFKVNPDHDHGNYETGECCRDFSMESSLNVSSRDDLARYEHSVDSFKTVIINLEGDKKLLQDALIENESAYLMNTDPAARQRLDREHADLESKIKAKDKQITENKKIFTKIEASRQDVYDEYSSQEDDVQRIPYWEFELEKSFSLQWLEEGSWSGTGSSQIYTRKAHLPSADADVVFRAVVTQTRGEKWFWFVRYHRSILSVDITLSNGGSNNTVVDVMALDPKQTDEQRAAEVNKRRQKIQNDYPDCQVTVELEHSDPLALDAGDNTVHLLWPSDRLRIAREVYWRLSTIYSKLVFLEKQLRTGQGLKSYLKAQVLSVLRSNIGAGSNNKSYQAWRRRARRVLPDSWEGVDDLFK